MAEGYDAAQWTTGVASGAASGVAAGSAAGPYGMLFGGLAGAGLGAYGTYESEKNYLSQQNQQEDLTKDLTTNDPLDRVMQAYSLGHRRETESAVLAAREAAYRGGLTPSAAAQLEMQAHNDAASRWGEALPSLYSEASQMDQARRAQVLNEYTTAQNLANSTAGVNYGAAIGEMGKNIATAIGTSPKSPQAGVMVTGNPFGESQVAQQAQGVGVPTTNEVWTATSDANGLPVWMSVDGRFKPVMEGGDPNLTMAAWQANQSYRAQQIANLAPIQTLSGPPVDRTGAPIVGGSPWNPAATLPYVGQTGGAVPATSTPAQGAAVAPVAPPQTATPAHAGTTYTIDDVNRAASTGDFETLLANLELEGEATMDTPKAVVTQTQEGDLDTWTTISVTDPSGRPVEKLVRGQQGPTQTQDFAPYEKWKNFMLKKGFTEDQLTPVAFTQFLLETE